ncbi:MAG: threonine/serine dehydratase [Burkholderiales bacterium]
MRTDVPHYAMRTDVSPDDIRAAAKRIAGRVRQTPVITLEDGAFGSPARAWLKLELLQHTGSFKPRGAFNRMLSADVPASGVIAASGGNHGIAVAFAARQLGYRAEIFLPSSASPVKVDRLRAFGAEVVQVGAEYAEAFAASEARRKESGALSVHAYDQPETVAGQGTLALEWEQQTGMPDTVLVAVGGGGLIAGILHWWQRRVRVIGVEPERCATLFKARAAKGPVDIEVGGLAADSLGARRIGAIAFDAAQRWIDDVVLVSDAAIAKAQRTLWNSLRIAAEPGGATALAAMISDAYRPAANERVGILVCGGNVDPATLTG